MNDTNDLMMIVNSLEKYILMYTLFTFHVSNLS